MGFRETARYFSERAAKARNEDNQKRFLEAATFYSSLAAISENFPQGYQPPKTFFANYWEARAEECRTMAEAFHDPQCREQMFRLADSYERLREAAE